MQKGNTMRTQTAKKTSRCNAESTTWERASTAYFNPATLEILDRRRFRDWLHSVGAGKAGSDEFIREIDDWYHGQHGRRDRRSHLSTILASIMMWQGPPPVGLVYSAVLAKCRQLDDEFYAQQRGGQSVGLVPDQPGRNTTSSRTETTCRRCSETHRRIQMGSLSDQGDEECSNCPRRTPTWGEVVQANAWYDANDDDEESDTPLDVIMDGAQAEWEPDEDDEATTANPLMRSEPTEEEREVFTPLRGVTKADSLTVWHVCAGEIACRHPDLRIDGKYKVNERNLKRFLVKKRVLCKHDGFYQPSFCDDEGKYYHESFAMVLTPEGGIHKMVPRFFVTEKWLREWIDMIRQSQTQQKQVTVRPSTKQQSKRNEQ